MVKKIKNTRRWTIKWYWWLLGAVIIAGIIYWQSQNILNSLENIANSIWNTMGWGLVIIPLAIIILLVVLFRQGLSTLLPQIRIIFRVLGTAAMVIALWGILAFAGLGGSVGKWIIGGSIFIGGLRVIGYLIFGFVLIAPVVSVRLLGRFFSWVVRKIKREPEDDGIMPSQPPPTRPVYAMPPRESERFSERERKPIISHASINMLPVQNPPAPPPPAVASPPQDLKQVAQDVWKKYGESPSLETIDGWRLPPIDILERSPEIEFSQADNAKRAHLLEEALSSYGVEAKVIQINPGPTVTQFGLEPGWDRKTKEVKEKDKDGNVKVRLEEVSRTRVKVERITALSNDLALTLAAPSIRIEAPVPGKSVVGVEVPNTISTMVSLRGVVETNAFQRLKVKSKMALALGKGAGGEAIAADLVRMPHLLIAGATGSGKTVCLNTIISSLLLHNTPNEVQFILIDPKRVELTPYNSIPHLAVPVIVDTDKSLIMLHWLNEEMDRRYKKLAASGVRNIDGYNKTRQGLERMSYLVLVIDELADLMMTSSDETEHTLCRLAQLARAAGIHLVVATQRPSVDIVTGLIKANFPSRISFAVTSQVDSRTILDGGGAEKLLGRGDMLFMPTEADKPKRLQGCYVSDAEVERLVYFWNSQQKDTKQQLNLEELVTLARDESSLKDPLMETARQLAQEHKHISASFLQRHLRIGYPRAARIMEQLEEEKETDEDGN